MTPEEGGRKTGPPIQGYRSDFRYEDESNNKCWMIHPEFLDEKGNVILDRNILMSQTGQAKMWILNDQLRDFHKSKIKIGTKGFFVEGHHKTAICEVIDLVGLHD